MRRSSGLQFPRAGALVGCGPREAVSEVKKPTAGLNCGKNLTHRRWVSGENQEDGAVQGLRRWPAWLLDPRRATAATCGDENVMGGAGPCERRAPVPALGTGRRVWGLGMAADGG